MKKTSLLLFEVWDGDGFHYGPTKTFIVAVSSEGKAKEYVRKEARKWEGSSGPFEWVLYRVEVDNPESMALVKYWTKEEISVDRKP